MRAKRTKFPDQTLPVNRFLTRRMFLKGTVFAGLGLAPFLGEWVIMSHETKDVETAREGITMELTEATSISNAGIPPIDAAAPTQTETATFALG